MPKKIEDEVQFERRLRHRLEILHKKIKDRSIQFPKNLDFNIEESLLAIRVGSDGEIDLNTVDAKVRSIAFAANIIDEREELKKSISLVEIQNEYFEFIEHNFGHFYKIMLEKKFTPDDVGTALTQNPQTIKEIVQSIDDFLSVINEFWLQTGEIAHMHIQDMKGNVKGIFGGDLFPTHNENIASKCGIYADTIILPDPFLRSKHIFKKLDDKSKAYYLIKHAMNILQYKELACADIEIPIIVILPDFSALHEEEMKFFYELGLEDSLIHSEKLFGRQFESVEDLYDFAQSLDSIEKTIAEIKDINRVLFDTNWKGDISIQLQRVMKRDDFKSFGLNSSPGMILASQSVGRMSISNELLIKARRLNGTPVIDAPTSWQYLAWKMEYDSERIAIKNHTQNLHILRGIQDLGKSDMEWLGNIPISALIEIRKEGVMDEIREILGKGVNELIDINPSNFHRSKDQIFDNIIYAFNQHVKNIEKLKSKKWKFVGQDIGSWMVTGTLEVTAAMTGTPIWGLSMFAADQLLDTPKLKDIPKSIRDLAIENNKIKKSTVGMLFSISKKS